jgi:hypothetical protein
VQSSSNEKFVASQKNCVHVQRELAAHNVGIEKKPTMTKKMKKVMKEHITIALDVYGIIWNNIMLHKKN